MTALTSISPYAGGIDYPGWDNDTPDPERVGPLRDGCPLCGSDASVYDDNGHITASCDADCGWTS